MKYSFEELSLASPLIRNLIEEQSLVADFTNKFFSKKMLLEQCKTKSFSSRQRDVLTKVLDRQNAKHHISVNTSDNISKLKNANTYTITTGHQLNLATGPLYTLYKILEVINWCEELNGSDEDNYFVPVFWMATEDHDFDEINHINLFGSKLDWQHHSVSNSVVGRIETKGINTFMNSVLEKFRDEEIKFKVEEFLACYQSNKTLAEANRELIYSLFGTYGIVIIDGDDSELKEMFAPIAKLEIQKSITFNSVSETNRELDSLGFRQQVFVRENNLFYIKPNSERTRIEKQDAGFLVDGQKISANNLLELVENFPERFSPNALLRPVYQETVLPNVAYIGGAGEIAYWLQLKATFESFNLEFPLLKVRESVILIDHRLEEQMAEFDFSIVSLKADIDDILRAYVKDNQKVELSLQEQKESLNLVKRAVLDKALLIDKNATSFIEAEFQKMNNQLEKMEKKFIAAEKKNQEKSIKQIRNLQNRIYPNGGFQERFYNYLSYIHYPSFVENLKSELKNNMTETAAVQIVKI